MIDQIMEYNKKFVENKGYEPFLTSKYPDKKLAILTLYGHPFDRASSGSSWYQKWSMPRSSRMQAVPWSIRMEAW